MRLSFARRRRIDAATIARLTDENTALRHALANLGRQLHATQTGPLGDTAPMPRVRSAAPVAHDHGADLVLPFPPAEWTR